MTPRQRLLLSFASGAFVALAAPPTNVYPALWLGTTAYAVALDDDVPKWDDRNRRRLTRFLPGALRGILFGAGANIVALRFVPDVIARFTPLGWGLGVLALVLLGLFQGWRFAVGAVLGAWLRRLRVPRFLAFAIGIYASTFVPVVFPWSAAGGVSPWPVMVQLADLVGERGVTFLMALSSALLAEAFFVRKDRKRALSLAVASLLLPLLTAAHGALRMAREDGVMGAALHARVALVQPMTEAKERWDSNRAEQIALNLGNLTRSAEAKKPAPDLVVWPEASFPFALNEQSGPTADLMGSYAILQPGVHGPVLAGVMTHARGGGSYNSAVLASGGRVSMPYHKMHLLSFGEEVPFSSTFPALRTTFAQSGFLLPGKEQRVFEVGPIRATVLICFEDNLPEAGREAAKMNPNLFVNITNDAWFFGSTESELHLRLAVLRSVEHRRDMVRAVNRGPTSWVDAAGRVRARWPDNLAGSLVVEPALLESDATTYGRFGDVPTILLAAIAAAAFALRHKMRRAPTKKADARRSA
ncbi:apolipoprotein N-acyltransferase [soil metagenome]